ncbi:MAG TPA: ATP synthase F1 subunit epsilon [Bacteroidales bacterium]|jgi:F-type H+-transporting ATPase subunit epsilon|nr:ATP synthase F1 subunit epsilon [Bacteroidales bacterium]
MFLEILTPEKKLYSGESKLIQVPGSEGSFELMNKHAPVISSLSQGAIKVITPEDQSKFFNVSGGILEMKDNRVIILVEKLVD